LPKCHWPTYPYLIYSYSFTQALLQREAAFRKPIYRPMLEARKSTIK